jgi:ankyrin repeat protein
VAAVQAGEIPIVEYVASLPDIDLNAPWTTYNNQSALLEAVTANRYDLAEVLIMSSSDKAKLVNQANSRGCTPLMGTFIKWTNEELVELLINAGADVHATDSSGSTALCYAVEYGTVAAASPLISAGASFSVSRADNRSLLHLAADDLTVRWLHKHLGHNLDPNVQDKFGMTAICQEFARKVLASDKISAMLECFGDRMDLYIRDNHAHHALDILKSRNHADLQVTFRNFAFRDPERAMRYVIEATTSKLVVDGLPRVILELPKERMQSILAIHDGAGRTALHAACKTRNVMLIKSLTSAGASPNTRDSFGRTPLHIICGSELPQATSRFLNSTLESRTDIIALLASVDSAPLDANVIDSSGYTPLTYAIRSGLDSVAQSLVDNYGASWYPASAASSTTFRSPLAVALSVDSPLYAVLAKSPELVNRIDLESNSTPLALAAAAKRLDLEVIKVLVENGADVTPAIDDLRRRISNNSPIAPLLLEKGVQLEMGASPALEAPFNPLEGIFGGFTPSQPSPFGPPPSNMFATMAPTDQAASDHQPSQALQPPLDLFGAGAFQPAPQEQQQQQPPLNLFGGFQLPAANSNNSPNVFRFS